MNVKDIVSLVMLGIGLLFVGLGILKNRKNHWIYAIARVSVVVISVLLSMLISGIVGGVLASVLFDVLKNLGALDDMSDLMREVPTLEETFRAIVGCVFALFLFVIVFLILKAILNGIAKPIARKIIVSKDLKHTAAYEPETVASETEASEAEVSETEASEAEASEAEVTVEEPSVEEKPKLKGKAKRRFKKKALRTPKANVFGMLGGAIGCLLVWVALFAPLVGVCTMVDDGLSILDSMEEPEEEMAIVLDIVDIAANNAGSKAITYLGGKPIFVGLTTCQVGGHSVSLTREISFLSVTGDALLAVNDKNADKDVVAGKIRAAGKAFSKTDLLPVLIPDICHAASKDWNEGKDFCGIEKPSVEGELEMILDPFMDILAESNYDTVKEDVNTVIELAAEIVEADALKRMEDNPIRLFEDTEFSSGMLKTLLDNDRMDAMIGGILEFGVQSIGESFGMYKNGEAVYQAWISDLRKATDEFSQGEVLELSELANKYQKVFDEYGMNMDENAATVLALQVAMSAGMDGEIDSNQVEHVVSQTDLTDAEGRVIRISAENIADETVLELLGTVHFDSDHIIDTEAEAKAMAEALAEVAKMVESMDSENFQAADAISKLGKVMDRLAATQTVGSEDVGHIVIGLLQSKEVHSSLGISVYDATDIAESIVEGANKQSYAKLMASVGETVRVLESVNSDQPLEETVAALVETLDPNSAKVLQSMAKPSIMIANGVPEENAEASANLMSSMFGNLADMGEDMSQEDFDREAQAITNMTNLAMNMDLSGEGDTFGENGSLGVSAEEFVDEILDSKVMTKTLRETVYADDSESPAVDPLNSKISLNEAEETEFLEMINTRWTAEEDTANEEVRQNYIALGAMLNMELEITDSGIQMAS